jgi:hypothetical protein
MPDPQLLMWLFLGALVVLGYFLLKDTFYIHDLEQAIKSSPDAQHFLKEVARKRKEAMDELRARTQGLGERCEECGWYKGLLIDDQNNSTRKCINSSCPSSKGN